MAKSTYLKWRKRVEAWRKMYADVEGFEYKPENIKVRYPRCEKCYKMQRSVARHHKGHEYVFSCILPDVYAARYLMFYSEDVVQLCSDCHLRIHRLYRPLIHKLNEYIMTCAKDIKLDEETALPIYNWRTEPDLRVLESIRLSLVRKCNTWLARRNKKDKGGYK